MFGTVTKLLPDKGYGFIRDENGTEHFFHHSEFRGHWDDLAKDFEKTKSVKVEFDPVTSSKGPRASYVTRSDWPNQS